MTDKEQAPNGPRLFGSFIFLAIFIGAGVIIGLYHFGYLSIQESIPLVDATETVGTLLLSFLLVVLYLRMFAVQKSQVAIQNKQTRIMERQEEMMEANHLPIIEYKQNEIYADGDIVTIPISNYGNGIAKNIRIKCDIRIEDSDSDIDLKSSPQPLQRLNTSSVETMSERTSSDSNPEPRHAIYPQQTDIPFRGLVQVMGPVDEESVISTMPFQTLMRILADRGVEEISFYLWLKYEDITNRDDEEQILGRSSVEVDGQMTLEEGLDSGNPSALSGTITIESPSTIQSVRMYINRIYEKVFTRSD